MSRDFDEVSARCAGVLPQEKRARHDRVMRLPWSKPKVGQLELLDADPELQREPSARERSAAALRSTKAVADQGTAITGHPLLVLLDCLSEDPHNPRTEFPQAEIDELAASIRQHGILQPLVVGPADTTRLICRQADAGDSNATIAKCLGIDQTTIAHHLALLDLPPELNDVMQAGRCTSPRTLYELKKLHHEQPERVRALLGGEGEITRGAVNAVRVEAAAPLQRHRQQRSPPTVVARADSACALLEHALDQVAKAGPRVADADLQPLKQRPASLGNRLASGVGLSDPRLSAAAPSESGDEDARKRWMAGKAPRR